MPPKGWSRVLAGLLVLTTASVSGAASAAAEAERDRPEYLTEDECWEAERISCRRTGHGTWEPITITTIEDSTLGWSLKEREPGALAESVRQMDESMDTDISGTPEHPVVAVDMDQVIFPDAKPWINPATNRTMIPIRFVTEAMGMEVRWDGATETVTVRREGLTVTLQVGSHTAYVNGEPLAVDAPPILVPPGRVLVPLRFIAEAFGATVDWVGEESPDKYDDNWGDYQVWIWVPWGYWGSKGIKERLTDGGGWWWSPEPVWEMVYPEENPDEEADESP